MTIRPYIAAITGNILTFVTSTALTWSSPVLPKLADSEATPFEEALTSDQISWVSSLLPLGAIFGPFIYGFLADKIGRKTSLLICGVPLVGAFLVLAFAKLVEVYYVCRFVSGLSVGGLYAVMPMYAGEIAEDSNRGALGSIMGTSICAGLFFSYLVGPFVSLQMFNLILAAIPALYIVLFLALAPESPHYYVAKNKTDSAKSALAKLRGKQDDKINKELQDIQAKMNEEGSGTFFDIFRSKGLTKALVISVGLVSFQQLSGINAVLFYSQTIFEEANTPLDPALCSIIIGVVQFVGSFITPFVVDTLGRKILLLISGVGMLLSEIVLGIHGYLDDRHYDVSSVTFLSVLCLVVYIFIFNLGFGPLPWAMLGELFPSNVKSAASSFSAAMCWFLAFIITKYFTMVSKAIGMGPTFLIFASFCAVSIPFCIFYVIETKGKSLQEIQDILNK